MDELKESLRTAFEDDGYDVADVTINRDQVRVGVLDSEASAEALREVTYGVVDEDDMLGLNVTTESADGQDGMMTVVTFRYRG